MYKSRKLCSHIQMGCRGEAPARKNDVILRACPQAYTPEGSRAAPPFTRGGAVPVRSGLMFIIVKL